MPSITNVAAYRFAALRDLKPLRARLLDRCLQRGLKGTILLSVEGINLVIAGARVEVDGLFGELRTIPGLEDLEGKFSESDELPFRRMIVRIKKEIIAFGQGIDPVAHPTRTLSPTDLKRWLDEGRDVVLLDTRNRYEVKLGTFRPAMTLPIDHFRDFPEAVRGLSPELKKRTIVTFCTGGIRCEKAGPFLEREGFEDVYQLEGGILRYFEHCGGHHFDGECFVFDHRVGLDAALRETDSAQCFACQTPLSSSELADPRYVEGRSCTYCYLTDVEQRVRSITMRQERIRRATTPLPGSVPYESRRPVNVPASFDGFTLSNFLEGLLRHVPPQGWVILFEHGRLLGPDMRPVGHEHRVSAGERYYLLERSTVEPSVNPDLRILHEDEAIIVVHKPAPLPMHPSGRFNRNTAQAILSEAYHPQKPRPGHRLDACTSGVAVFARNRHFAGLIQPQFERGEVEKLYLARIQGHPPEDHFRSTTPIVAAAGPLGLRRLDPIEGLPAETHFDVLERSEDGTALLSVVPVTGRTNQIRLHLWERGWPIQGDPLYLPGGRVAGAHSEGDFPLMLLSRRLTFTHPLTRLRVTFEAELPEWAANALAIS